MIDIFLGIVQILFSIGMTYLFVNIFASRKVEYTKVLFAIWCVIVIIISILLKEHVLIKTTINFLLAVIFSYLIFDVGIKRSILYNALYISINVSIEFISLVLLQLLTGEKNYSSILNSEGAFIAEIICLLIMLVVIIIISAAHKSSYLSRLDVNSWLAFSLFPIFSTTVIIFFVVKADENVMLKMHNVFIFIGIGLFLLNCILFYLINNVIQREVELSEKNAIIEQAEYITNMYETLSVEREKQKAKTHDYVNHLNVLLALAQSGNHEKEIEYISEQLNNEIHSIDMFDTGNPIVNAVINTKYNEANAKGITFPIVADDLSNISIANSDLVAILSNLIDNAIEATEKSEEKRILLKIKNGNSNLIINIENTFMPINKKNGLFSTTKDDKENHGYGMKNIKQNVLKNSGQLFVEVVENVFHITIVIPL